MPCDVISLSLGPCWSLFLGLPPLIGEFCRPSSDATLSMQPSTCSSSSSHITTWITPHHSSSHMVTSITYWMVMHLFAHQILPFTYIGGQGQCNWLILTPSTHTADLSIFLEESQWIMEDELIDLCNQGDFHHSSSWNWVNLVTIKSIRESPWITFASATLQVTHWEVRTCCVLSTLSL